MRLWLALLVAAGVLACGGERSAASASGVARQASDTQRAASTLDSLMARVIPAAAITLAVQATPARADSILAASGFTLDRFEATLYSIAADSAASQLFESALGR